VHFAQQWNPDTEEIQMPKVPLRQEHIFGLRLASRTPSFASPASLHFQVWFLSEPGLKVDSEVDRTFDADSMFPLHSLRTHFHSTIVALGQWEVGRRCYSNRAQKPAHAMGETVDGSWDGSRSKYGSLCYNNFGVLL